MCMHVNTQVSRNYEYNAPFVRLEYSSFITPPSTFDYFFTPKRLVLRKTLGINSVLMAP